MSDETRIPGAATTDARPVIVVEDDASMSRAMARILRLAGIEPLPFSSAEEVLGCGVEDAMCMIVDVQLPGMTGFALCERLASRTPAPPVIFITAFDDADTRSQAALSGAAAFLTKPFSGRTLVETVRRVSVPSS